MSDCSLSLPTACFNIAAITLAGYLAGGLPVAFAGITISISPNVIKQSETHLAKITAIATLNPCSEPQIPGVLNCKLDYGLSYFLLFIFALGNAKALP